MGKNNNIIEINGKSYDARTGAPLGHPSAKKQVIIKDAAPKHPAHDVVHRQTRRTSTLSRPMPSKTLMRHAVKKPSHHKTVIRAQASNDSLIRAAAAELAVKQSAKKVNRTRLAKASQVAQSHLIQHFSPVVNENFQPGPPAPPRPLVEPSKPLTPTPRPAVHHAKAVPKRPNTTSELLEHALRSATSHEQPATHHKRAERGLKLGTASLVAVLAIGILGYQAVPDMQLHLASAKAGFNAGLPDYRPAGYSLSQLNYSPGVVATSFSSNSDDRGYSLTQKKTNWDSQALRDEFVEPRDDKFQVVENGGNTIYIYGDNNATWVNGGVWYQVQSHGSLSNKQLVSLATSL